MRKIEILRGYSRPFFFVDDLVLSNTSVLPPLVCSVCFEGHIPSTLGRLVNLTQLDLSFNKLSGGIPSEVRTTCHHIHSHIETYSWSIGVVSCAG